MALRSRQRVTSVTAAAIFWSRSGCHAGKRGPCPIGGRGWQRDNLVAQMLSNSAVLRPTAPRLESAATQHNDKRGASDNEKQDIE